VTQALSGSDALYILLFCFVVTIVGTPIARGLAHHFGFIDRPRAGGTKKHDKPVAYLGGLFIFIALATGIIITLNAISTSGGTGAGALSGVNLTLIFLAVTFIFFVGLIDDILGIDQKRAGLHPGLKMLLLATGGTILYMAGVKVGFIQTGSVVLDHALNYPLTIFWILGITNAANVIDNMNGVSVGSGVVAGIFFLLLGIFNSDAITIGLSLVLIGTMFGFIFYNYPKASIFLGDSGSVTHGFYLAMLGLLAGRPDIVEGHALTGTLAPIFVLMFFVYDTWFVALNRGRRGINFWWGGLDHTTHRLNNIGFSKSFVAVLIWVLNILCGAVAIIIYFTPWWFAVPFCLVAFSGGVRFWMYLGTIPIEEIDISLIGAPTKGNH